MIREPWVDRIVELTRDDIKAERKLENEANGAFFDECIGNVTAGEHIALKARVAAMLKEGKR